MCVIERAAYDIRQERRASWRAGAGGRLCRVDQALEPARWRGLEVDGFYRFLCGRQVETQHVAYGIVPHVHDGQWLCLMAYRSHLKGVIVSSVPFFWNMEKE